MSESYPNDFYVYCERETCSVLGHLASWILDRTTLYSVVYMISDAGAYPPLYERYQGA